MPAQYAQPYVKRGKNDAADAEAICEAVSALWLKKTRKVPLQPRKFLGFLLVYGEFSRKQYKYFMRLVYFRILPPQPAGRESEQMLRIALRRATEGAYVGGAGRIFKDTFGKDD